MTSAQTQNSMQRTAKREWVPLGKMRIPPHAQRDLKPPFVAKLLANFDLDRFGYPVVSKRGDLYHVLDGQQRTAALRQWIGDGWERQKVECQVFHGLNDADEAGLFVDLNFHLNVQAIDKYQKQVEAGREPESSVESVVRSCGLVTSKGKGAGHIVAVSALVRVYQRTDGQALAKTLRILSESYGDRGLEGHLIEGIGLLCQRYNGGLEFENAVKRLSSVRGGVNGLLGAAEVTRRQTGCSRPHSIAGAAVEIINQGRGGKKLPAWWKES